MNSNRAHKNTADLLNPFFSCGLVPCITKPTRITHSTATLIDNLYIKPQREDKLHSGIILYEFADHLPVFLFSGKPTMRQNKEPLIFRHRQLNDTAIQNISYSLDSTDWSYLHGLNIDQAFCSFSDKLNDAIDNFAPEKTVTIPFKLIIRDPWVTKGILKSSRHLDKLFKVKIKQPPEHISHANYIQYRNLYNKVKRISKQAYYATLLHTYKDDIKNTWKSIRTLLGKSNDLKKQYI
jgi:hypothetical protein